MISKVFMFKLQPSMRVLPAINICYNFSQAWDFLALQTPNNKNPHLFATKQHKPEASSTFLGGAKPPLAWNPGNRNLQWYEEAKPKSSNTSEFGYLSKPTGGRHVASPMSAFNASFPTQSFWVLLVGTLNSKGSWLKGNWFVAINPESPDIQVGDTVYCTSYEVTVALTH